MLATLADKTPASGPWVHEIKFDGYRLQAHVGDGLVKFYTRRGHDWTKRFGWLAEGLQGLKTHGAILDGEVVVLSDDGLSDFGALEADLGSGRSDRFHFYLFDLLYLDALDLRDVPLIERKGVLRELLAGTDPPIHYSEHLEADGAAVFKDACKLGLEGVVSKVTTGKYRSGRRNEWVKVTCRKRDTFIVAGIAYKRGKFDGIYLAREKGKALEYAGKVENGFTDAAVKQLERRSVKLATRKSPLSKAIKKPKARWLKPRLLAEVEYRALTGAGKVRHPSFKGLREDLSAERIA